MFTGIVQGLGALVEVTETGRDRRMVFSAPEALLEGASVGDSMSVSGACLTMLDLGGGRFSADVSSETLALTTLWALRIDGKVNLEPALCAGQRLGGHLVSGHVDGRAHLVSRIAEGESETFRFRVPDALSRYIARKGSVCLDGVSLTINEVDGDEFTVRIIPHTLKVTTLGVLAEGGDVNLEVDMVARYLERLMSQGLES